MDNKSTHRYAAAGLAAVLTLAMLSTVQVLFDEPTAAPAYAAGGTVPSTTQVVVIEGKRLSRS